MNGAIINNVNNEIMRSKLNISVEPVTKSVVLLQAQFGPVIMVLYLSLLIYPILPVFARKTKPFILLGIFLF